MEKYARQALSEGIKNGEDLHVTVDNELYRVLNLHYNRNNHIEVPSNFRYGKIYILVKKQGQNWDPLTDWN